MKLTFVVLALLFIASACNPMSDAPSPSDEKKDEKENLPEHEQGKRY